MKKLYIVLVSSFALAVAGEDLPNAAFGLGAASGATNRNSTVVGGLAGANGAWTNSVVLGTMAGAYGNGERSVVIGAGTGMYRSGFSDGVNINNQIQIDGQSDMVAIMPQRMIDDAPYSYFGGTYKFGGRQVDIRALQLCKLDLVTNSVVTTHNTAIAVGSFNICFSQDYVSIYSKPMIDSIVFAGDSETINLATLSGGGQTWLFRARRVWNERFQTYSLELTPAGEPPVLELGTNYVLSFPGTFTCAGMLGATPDFVYTGYVSDQNYCFVPEMEFNYSTSALADEIEMLKERLDALEGD